MKQNNEETKPTNRMVSSNDNASLEQSLLAQILLKVSNIESEIRELKAQLSKQASSNEKEWISEYAAAKHPKVRSQGIKTRARLRAMRLSHSISPMCYRQYWNGCQTVTEYQVDLLVNEIDAYKSSDSRF